MTDRRADASPQRPAAPNPEPEEFTGGEPVCWLEFLDEDGNVPDSRRSHPRHEEAATPGEAGMEHRPRGPEES